MGHAKSMTSAIEQPDYETDFHDWSFHQAELVRDGRFSALDIPNLIEELESMGNEQRHALTSCYRVLLLHLLKWRYQPARRSRSWRGTIDRERGNIEDRETTNESLARKADELVSEAYRHARRQAASETGLPLTTFSADCPFTLAQLRDDEFLPD